MRHSSISRRDFLEKTLLGGAGLALAGSANLFSPLAAGAEALVPGKEQLIVRSLRYYDLEAPVGLLKTWITPVNLFFVRNHMSEPFAIDVAAWQLTVDGEVKKPLKLTLADLAKMQQSSVTNTLECAGNGRSFYQPHVPGIQWQRGAVGNAKFTGARLKDILERAGVKNSGKHVMFRGLDEPPQKVPAFIRSIPIDKAMDPDTLVATHMNGAPLVKHHGFPARALVPGWIGAASCKWLAHLQVLDHEFDGNFMKPGYRMPNNPVPPGGDMNVADSSAVTRLNVKSLITQPADGSRHRMGSVRVAGVAWAGDADVGKVEISTDDGQSWQPAQLGSDHARYAWRLWEHAWKPKSAGEHSIMARATDSQGRVQPAQPPWNPSGYLWNGIEKVSIHVGS